MSGGGGGDRARLVLLGTAGGPLPSPVRSGISQAVVVGGRAYVVDCGSGVTRQLRRARLLRHLDSVFVTHLHSDHVCDYFNLFLLGWVILQDGPPVRVYGPCGLAGVTEAHLHAHAYDIRIRIQDSGRHDIHALFDLHEIGLPDAGATAATPAPRMRPFTVHEDERVRVSATLVEHGPVFPSFAFRFDMDGASVVISGDTVPCANLIDLAAGADVLVHEVYDDAAPSPDAGDASPEAELRERHLRTSHTPLSEIGRVAADARVRRLVLTHFIPGDDALPDEHWMAGVRGFDGEVIVGADLMELAL